MNKKNAVENLIQAQLKKLYSMEQQIFELELKEKFLYSKSLSKPDLSQTLENTKKTKEKYENMKSFEEEYLEFLKNQKNEY